MCRYVFFLCFPVFVIAQEVTTAKYYDNRQMAYVYTTDDMFNISPVVMDCRWTNFFEVAELGRANHVCITVALITEYVVGDGWSELQAEMGKGYFVTGNHSGTHPSCITDYERQYVESRQTMYDNLEFPWQQTYEGREYINCMMQFGGCTNIDWTMVDQILTNANYLLRRLPGGYDDMYTEWDSYKRLFENMDSTESVYAVLDGNFSNKFDQVYASGGVYHLLTHVWQDVADVNGSNAEVWTNYFEYVGNRHDVWYTDPDSLYTYHYLQAISPPTITCSNISGDIIISVTGDHEERVKYGLSYPLTYKLTKPESWLNTDGVCVYYRDVVNAEWTLMEEKTARDYFSGINVYRDADDIVYISQGFPQACDSFELLVRPYTIPENVLSNYVVNHAEELGLYPSNVVLDVRINQMLLHIVGGMAHLSLQLEKSDDLHAWTNASDLLGWAIPVETNKQFFRVRITP